MGRKAKKGNESSLDDYWNEGVEAGDAAGSVPPAVEEEEAVDLSKKSKKKKKKDDPDEEEEPESKAADLPGAKKKSAKNAKKKNLDDEDTITTASVDDDEEGLDLSAMKKKKPKKKDKKKGVDDDGGDAEAGGGAEIGLPDEEAVLDLSAMKKKKPKKKDKKKGGDEDEDVDDPIAAASTASREDDEELPDFSAMKKKGKKDKKKDEAPVPVAGFAALALDDDLDEAEATADDEEEMPDFSSMKKKKKIDKKGRKDEVDEVEVPAPASVASPDDEEEVPDFSTMKKKKGKKDKKKGLDDEADVPAAASTAPDSPEDEEVIDFSSMKKKKGKKEKKKQEEDDAEPELTAPATAKAEERDEEEDLLDFSSLKKKKPKKKEKKSADDERNEQHNEPEAPHADVGIPAAASPDDEEEVLDLTGMKKKPKKKGKKKTADDDYPEAAAQDWEVPTAESARTAAPEPVAAAVAPADAQNNASERSTKVTEEQAQIDEAIRRSLVDYGADKAAVPDTAAAPAAPDEDEKLELPGAKKKKSKKKKPGEKKAEDAADPSAPAAPAAPAPPDAEGDKKDEGVPAKEGEAAETTGGSKKKKKKGSSAEAQEPKQPKVVEKKVPKHVREMQERLAKMKEEEERRKREEEEKLRKEEEERLRLEEEERQREEAKQRRKQREKEKIRDKKAKGLYLTGKQKEEARRLAIMREQILASNPGLVAGEEPSPTPRKPKYETKKKKVSTEDVNAKEEEAGARAEEAENHAEEAEVEAAAEEAEAEGNGEVEEAAAPPPAAEEAQEEEEQEEDEDDDWEAKSWDESKLPTVKDAFADEDEEEEEPAAAAAALAKAAPARAVEKPPAPAPAAISREARLKEALSKRSADDLRSPICCILGHVDTGKTKLLDCIRRTNVQEGEAGGITQQIGATYFPMENIRERTKELPEAANMRVPGLLVIDTPGHESFTNLRSRGSGLCDIAILVIDIMHGLEPQTIESINLLKMRKTPFIVALNKVDRLYGWKRRENSPIRTSLQEQEKHTRTEFDTRCKQIIVQLQEQALNSEVYWKNRDKRKVVSIVPTSALSGEGIPDLLYLLILLTQEMMEKKLMYVSEVQCTVLEVKVVDGHGTTIDVVLVNGVLHEGDQIVVCGLNGPIVTSIRTLMTPHPMKEIRVKGAYQHHAELKAAQGIKIAAHGLETAVAGTQLYIVGPDDDVETVKAEAQKDVDSVLSRVDKSGEGVLVQASTLGSLEALLEFLKSPDVNIPVSNMTIGPVHRKDVMRASVMLERKKPEFATILAFDVRVMPDARDLAEETGVKIFTADIIYHLFDQFTAYLKNLREEKRRDTAEEAVFPCILKILPNCVFNKKDPIIVGVVVLDGIAKVGTPICVPSKDGGEFIDLGRIASLEINHKVVDVAKKGDEVAMKIMGDENQKMFGRHFDYDDMLVSHITRRSIDILKENYRNELSSEEWKLVVKLKGIFKIM